MEYPDAPEGVLTHWVAWNIPSDAKEIREHTVPFGTREGRNVWGNKATKARARLSARTVTFSVCTRLI